MNKVILLLVAQLTILLGALTANAGSDGCGDWVKTRNGCSYGSHGQTWQWQRDCTNSDNLCGNPDHFEGRDYPCVADIICLPSRPNSNQSIDPNNDFSVCTRWERQDDVECGDIDGNLVPKWIRACQKHYIATSVCSRTRPPEWPGED